MTKYTGLNINKTFTILQNMTKYTGLNINKQYNNNTAEYDKIYRSKHKQTRQ